MYLKVRLTTYVFNGPAKHPTAESSYNEATTHDHLSQKVCKVLFLFIYLYRLPLTFVEALMVH